MKNLFEFTTTDSILFLVLVAMLLIAYFINKIIDQRYNEKMQIGEFNENLVSEDNAISAPKDGFTQRFIYLFSNLKEHDYIVIYSKGAKLTVNKKEFMIFDDMIFSVVHKWAGDVNKQEFLKLDNITAFEIFSKTEE